MEYKDALAIATQYAQDCSVALWSIQGEYEGDWYFDLSFQNPLQFFSGPMQINGKTGQIREISVARLMQSKGKKDAKLLEFLESPPEHRFDCVPDLSGPESAAYAEEYGLEALAKRAKQTLPLKEI